MSTSPAPATSPPSTNSTATPPATTATPPPTPSTTAPPPSPPPPTPTAPPPTTTPTAPPPSVTPSPPPPTTTSPPPPSTTPSPPSPSPPSVTTPPPSPPLTPPSPSAVVKPPPTPGGGGKSPSSGSGTGVSDAGGSGEGNSGISTGVIVGVVIAGVAVLVIVSLICVCFTRRRRKRRRTDDYAGGGGASYYVPPPPPPHHPSPPKEGHYGVQPQHWQQNLPSPPEHYQVPRPPPGAIPPRPPTRPLSPQLPPQPPPPPFMSSGGASESSIGSESLLPSPSPGISFGLSKSAFSYDELAVATNNFSEANILGQGGFGYVHKGILPNGKEVAVKSLKAGSGQGEREFQAEVEIISRVHHRHLVSLVGYCITGSHRLLVYEFVPNSTLEFHLHGKGRPTMDWPTRLKIALGSAKGLAYLHEDCHPKIIHRDIKAANILLTDKFEAMVADFGLAKFTSDANTHVSTRVMGTFGYLAPEYAASGKLTDKSDVFSFGVMLLELITGRRPVDPAYTYMDDSLVDWARPLLARSLEENNFESLVDPRLQNNYNPNEMARMVASASACVRHSARRRPPMSKVVRALEGEVSLSDLNEGVRPGHSSMYNSQGSSDYDSGQYKEDMKKFRQMAFASQEQGSSEYGGTTSEYGMNPSGSSTEETSRQTTQEMEMGKMKGDS